jgi:hypothetical protein
MAQMNPQFWNLAAIKCKWGWVEWFMLVIPALRRLRQEDKECEARLGYIKENIGAPFRGLLTM